MTPNLIFFFGPRETIKRKSLGPNSFKCERDVRLTKLCSIQGKEMIQRAAKESQIASKARKKSFFRGN